MHNHWLLHVLCICSAYAALVHTPSIAARAVEGVVQLRSNEAVRGFLKQQAPNDVGVSFVHCNFDADEKLLGQSVRALRKIPKLRSLESKFSVLSSRGVQAMTTVISASPCLRAVSILGSPLHALDTRALAYACIRHPSLARLSLCGCQLDDDAVKYVAYAIRHNPNMTHVNVSMNDISGLGIKCMAEVLEGYGDGLHALDLSYNPIGSQGGVEHLVDLLQHGLPNLKHLSIRGCKLKPTQLAVVLSAIANRKSPLTSLDIGGNSLVVTASSEAKKQEESLQGSIQRMLNEWIPATTAALGNAFPTDRPALAVPQRRQRRRGASVRAASSLSSKTTLSSYDLTVESKTALTVLTKIIQRLPLADGGGSFLGLASTGLTADALRYLLQSKSTSHKRRAASAANAQATKTFQPAVVVDLRLNPLSATQLEEAKDVFVRLLAQNRKGVDVDVEVGVEVLSTTETAAAS